MQLLSSQFLQSFHFHLRHIYSLSISAIYDKINEIEEYASFITYHLTKEKTTFFKIESSIDNLKRPY